MLRLAMSRVYSLGCKVQGGRAATALSRPAKQTLSSNSTWRFMGSYKWGYKLSVIIMATLLITPLITTHEPPKQT